MNDKKLHNSIELALALLVLFVIFAVVISFAWCAGEFIASCIL